MKSHIPYQWTAAGISFLIAGLIVFLIRKDLLHVRRSIWWLLLAVCVVSMGLSLRALDELGLLLGVSYPPILILTAGMGLILIKILTIDLDRSRHERMLRHLTQRLALAEERIERFAAHSASSAGRDDVPAPEAQPEERP